MRPSNALERMNYYNKNTVKNFKTDAFVKLLSPLYDHYRKDWYTMMVRQCNDLFPRIKWARLRPVTYFKVFGTPAMQSF
jgi:hypothetical protein